MTDENQNGANDTGDNSGSGGDGAGADWRSSLPAELGAAPYFRSAASLEQAIADMSTAAANAGNSLRIPGPDAGDDALNEFYAKVQEKAPTLMRRPDNDEAYQQVLRDLGMPDEADKYAMPDVEGIKLADERIGELKSMAHSAGLTGKQFDKFMNTMLAKDAEVISANNTARESALGELRGEWGAATDQRYEQVKKLLEVTGADASLVEAVGNKTVDAQTMRWFYAMADKMGGGGEGGNIGDQGKGEPPRIMTPEEATLQLSELEAKMIGKRLAPDVVAAYTKRRLELMQLANPESSMDTAMLQSSIHGS